MPARAETSVFSILALLLAAGAACRTAGAPGAASRSGATAPVGGAPSPGAALARPPSDPSRRLFGAQQRAQGGDAGGALELLEALDRGGWNVPLEAREFGPLASDPRFAALAARVAARAPRTPHSAPALTIAEPGLVPEGIALDPATGDLLVGSIRERKILRVAPDGAASELVPSGGDGLLAPLGLKVDPARGLLWAASIASEGMVGYEPAMRGEAALFAFDLATGALRSRVDAPAGEHLLNDLAIAEDGTVYVTDSVAGAVWRLAPGGGALEPFLPAGSLVYANGVVLGRGRLVVADAFGLVAVPLGAGAPRALEGPAGVPLGGIDGLALHRGALVGIQNALGAARIVRLRLDPEWERVVAVEVLEAGNPAWHIPTTGAVVGDALLYLGNSHLDGLSAEGLTPSAAAAPTRVFRLELGR